MNQDFFSVSSEQRGHAAHLLLSGELDLSTSHVLDGWLTGVESNGNTAIVLDLEQITFLDATGVRSFVEAAERARLSGRTFALVNAPAVVRKVLDITQTAHLLGSDPLSVSLESLSVGASPALC